MKRYPGSLPFPFARAVEANGFLFLSGQVSMNAQGDPVRGITEEQTQIVASQLAFGLEVEVMALA
ncbi:RidA family protein [Pantoea sp. CCBC3-3-1]|uniref:RidA family protein n=1 Tax=Pantoea sp. CCBC3-3-1 TaxID=2490851 RepID=UPI0011BE1294|nr:RidA family protein [Pantoea sp. CCBC3-3-1]